MYKNSPRGARRVKIGNFSENSNLSVQKVGRKINSLIDRVHSNDGHIRPELLVHEFLPDPLPVKDITVKSDEGYFTSYAANFTHVMLHGISGVKISSIRANVGKFTAKVSSR